MRATSSTSARTIAPALAGRSMGGTAVLLLVFILGPILCPTTAHGQADAKAQILILSAYHPGYRWSDAVLDGIFETINASLPQARLYVEHLDSKRINSQVALDRLADLIRVKYRNIRIDALIVSDDNSLAFLRKHRQTLFVGIPTIFCGANNVDPQRVNELAPITGVNEAADVKASIEVALKALPDTRRIVVVNDTTLTGRNVHQEIVAAAAAYEGQVEFTYLEELPFEMLLWQLNDLKPGTIVLYSFFFRDSRGRFYEYDESAAAVCAASKVPVFSLWEFNLGLGIVGGKLVSGYAQGSKAGELALRIIKGERPADIPIVMHSPNRFVFDFERIQHFSLDPDRLPPESIFINRPVSLYETHKTLIWTVSTALVTLTLLSGFLLLAIRRGRRSEAQLRASQDFLAGVTSNIPGVVYQFRITDEAQYKVSYVSEKSIDIFELDPNPESVFDALKANIHEADQASFWASIEEAVKKEAPWHFEGRYQKPSGEVIWFAGDSIPFRDGPELLFNGVLVDITARKRRVEHQRLRLERFQRQQTALIAMGNHTATIDGDVDSAIRFLSETMASALAVGRVGVWMLDEDGEELILTDGYDAAGESHTQGDHLKTALLPHYLRAQEIDWIIAANDALTDPRTEELAAGYLRSAGIGALLDAGVFVGGKLVGIICHEHMGGPRAWHSDEISLARSASEFLTRTILRAEHLRAQEALSKAERLWAQVINFLPDPTLAIDQEGRVIVWNGAMAELTGVTADQILGKGDYAYALPIWGDRCPIMVDLVHHWSPEVAAKYSEVTRKGVMLSSETKDLKIGARNYHFRNTAGPLFDDAGNSIGAIETVRDITASKNAELELRRRQEFVESVLYHAPDAIITLDANYRVMDWNPGAEQTFGYTRDESLGMALSDLITTGDARAASEMASKSERILKGDRVEAFETVRYRKDGTLVQVISAGSPIMVEGKLTGAVAMFTDITGLKKAEEEVRQRERMLRRIMDTVPSMIFVKNAEGRFLMANQAVADFFGKTVEQTVGRLLEELDLNADEAQHILAVERKILESQTPNRIVETFGSSNDDTSRWVETIRMPCDAEIFGEPAIVGLATDITERRMAEKEVNRLRNYLANIINSMPSALVGVDAKGCITQWNTQAEKLTGLPFDQVNARPLEAAMPLFKDEMARIQKAIRDRQVVHQPKVASQEDGETRFQDITIYPLVANGVEGAVIRVDDVTERVRMEEMMIQNEKMLSVGGLAAGMAHEINNPLAGILQNASVLENRLLGTLPGNDRAARAAGTSMEAIGQYIRARKLPEMVASIRASGDRAAAIVRNMLSFARKSNREISPREMGSLLDQTIELASTDYDMKKQYDFKRIKIIREYAPQANAVPCEESKIQQVFLNILKNGAEAMADGAQTDRPPKFILRVKDEDPWVRVEIQDNGPGMPEAVRKRVFEPFFTTKEVGQGTGLGLSVSYFIIVEDHGGEMAVTSELGGGSCFVIRLLKKTP